MSDGREEREEQEQRRKWEKEKKEREDDLDRDWERDGERERRDSRAVEALNAELRAQSGQRTRRSFLVAAAATAGGYGFYRWIDRSPGDQLIPKPLRKMLEFNAKVSRGVFDERGLAPTYPVDRSMELRTNGNYGLKMDLLPESYRLQMVGVANAKGLPQYVEDVTAWEYRYVAKKEAGPVEHDSKVAPKAAAVVGDGPQAKVDPNGDAGMGEGPMMQGGAASTMVAGNGEKSDVKMPPAFEAAFAALKKAQGNKRPRGQEEAGMSDNTLDPGTPGLLLKMDDVTSLPHHELVTEFKCIEGWSQVVHWGGYRLVDLIAKYPPEKKPDGSLPKYVYMETPDGDYYCGFSLQACMHPQSLLVTEMAGQPLAQWHGAPIRLHMPIKYGYKQIKRIGLIAYTDMRPDDYWTKLGYDWCAGL
ncbi:molybdopterin-dependent oxidoreductase [Tunturiibacter gelidoferens]|uniref:Molybdopterin-dependent oxidoreductase n=1 Tax=Tunturiibacter gelidiferens TaxID=3069689 RepID=A0AAU7Z398_9BACT